MRQNTTSPTEKATLEQAIDILSSARRQIRNSFLILALVALGASSAKAQSANRADCYITGIATATGEQITPGFDNRAQGSAIVPCTAWHLVYYASQASAVGIQIMYAPDLGGVLGPGSWSAATPVSGPTPLTSVNAAGHTSYTFSPWINVNVSTLTGAGAAIHWQLLGWRPGPSNDVAAPPISVIGNPGPTLNTGANDPCASSGVLKQNTFSNFTTAGTAQIIGLVANKNIYVCSILINWVGASQNFQFIQGTGTNCGTGPLVITPNFGNSTLVAMNLNYSSTGTIFTAGPSTELCGTAAGTTVLANILVTYVQQ